MKMIDLIVVLNLTCYGTDGATIKLFAWTLLVLK